MKIYGIYFILIFVNFNICQEIKVDKYEVKDQLNNQLLSTSNYKNNGKIIDDLKESFDNYLKTNKINNRDNENFDVLRNNLSKHVTDNKQKFADVLDRIKKNSKVFEIFNRSKSYLKDIKLNSASNNQYLHEKYDISTGLKQEKNLNFTSFIENGNKVNFITNDILIKLETSLSLITEKLIFQSEKMKELIE